MGISHNNISANIKLGIACCGERVRSCSATQSSDDEDLMMKLTKNVLMGSFSRRQSSSGQTDGYRWGG